ncbi:hypothetical protein TetV_233 [Tetraselmis virus 1]|uniref:Uncharacterized protein n=1 Tax=Tetraselmis virus 1 TaxID=2060617 RepID=A0A2P0VN40_9VIRU|nr:hypothetical protein QJ968_gp233 [Tetraselmis virus 1]AUF82325.1 hypothetical protein TetV_233 [Tetraselmis virus 1]
MPIVETLTVAGSLLVGGLISLEILMRSIRRSRLTKARICWGLFLVERDPLQGNEIAQDAAAANEYPDLIEDLKENLPVSVNNRSDSDQEE